MIRCVLSSGYFTLTRERFRDVVDAVLEFTVVASFSRVGFIVRRWLYRWPAGFPTMNGAVVVVTGATSGLGREVAMSMAHLGAHVVLVVRDAERGQRTCDEIIARSGNSNVEVVVGDLGDFTSVSAAAEQLRRFGAIDVLAHNAGSLQHELERSPQGIELTVAVHLLGPYLLTRLTMPQLEAGNARIIWVTSGGMYSQPLDVDALATGLAKYDGVATYARVKRAQVSLVARWAPRLASRGIEMEAMHPGWADTPGVQRSLPSFRRVMAPLLRSSVEGADTIIWLATSRGAREPGGLWLDRRSRRLHRLARTRRSDSTRERERLEEYCSSTTGFGDNGELPDW